MILKLIGIGEVILLVSGIKSRRECPSEGGQPPLEGRKEGCRVFRFPLLSFFQSKGSRVTTHHSFIHKHICNALFRSKQKVKGKICKL